MAWDFETDPEFQEKLTWAAAFVRDEVEPLDLVLGDPYDRTDTRARAIAAALQARVREKGLWACHLEPELGGEGYGQLKLALLNEVIGASRWAPTIFGCQAPDSGNAEILARYGTAEQKATYLQPLLDGDICSCYSMTEPQAGADPTLFTTAAVRDGDEWVLNGEKWFSSNARYASFLLVMAVTNKEVGPYQGQSMFIVPTSTPGVQLLRNVGLIGQDPERWSHGHVRYEKVRLPADSLLGEEGQGFAVAQTRLGGGRIHHAMRTIALARKAFDLMCERALSRQTRHGRLADNQVTQQRIAESWIELEQFRLLVLRTAWLIDRAGDYKSVRKDIAAVKIAMPKVLHDIAQRALHLHGSIGVSADMPFMEMMLRAEVMGIGDGPTEVHQVTLAKQLLKGYRAGSPTIPSGHIPTLRTAAEEHVDELLAKLEIAGS